MSADDEPVVPTESDPAAPDDSEGTTLIAHDTALGDRKTGPAGHPLLTDHVDGDTKKWRRLRWVFTRRLCFGGLAGALFFFCASMAPSLVPRSALMQGFVSGMAASIGYGCGSLLSVIIRRIKKTEPGPGAKRVAWIVLSVSTLLFGAIFLTMGLGWQGELRESFEMESLGLAGWLMIVLVTICVALIIILIARLVRGLTKGVIGLLDRVFPHHITVMLSVGFVAILMTGFAQGVLLNAMTSAMNSIYSTSDKGTSAGISKPTLTTRSGSPDSLIDFDTLGLKGRDFVGDGGGPTSEEIEAFTGESAMDPIRVYVGLRTADDVDDRVDLALAELDRTGAFERAYLIISTTTGTGWVDENVVDSIEFMHGGNTAQIAMQYSYLPSWVSFLVDRTKASETGEQLITAVSDRLNSLPADERPKLLVFGESLGSYGTEAAFTSPENMLSNVDGAMLVGPTFVNPIHSDLIDARDEGSPAWRPLIDGGESIRFGVEPSDFSDESIYSTSVAWGDTRVVYLQNSSDPITYFNYDLVLTKPEWLDGEKGPDVSDDMVYVPFVSFFQIAADMAFAMSVPDGHGHRYGSSVVEGWAQIAAPDGWTDADTQELRELTDQRQDERRARKAAGG